MKTGLFFGSFNPIHNGHLTIARFLLDEGYCEEVWFVVSPQNPWKREADLEDFHKRLQIVEDALVDERAMRACDVEATLPRPSYTYQTLRRLKELYPDRQFALVIGGDNGQKFQEWKNYREILANHVVFVYPRPGSVSSTLIGGDLVEIHAPLSELSSTEIRRKLRAGECIANDVPVGAIPKIIQYYQDHLSLSGDGWAVHNDH